MNVGAETETDYGDYFMWGSTEPNTADECTWANAPFNGGSTSYSADAFNLVKDTACPNGILAKAYDAASQIMGGDWRMPTRDELNELARNTTIEWITDYNGSTVNGYKLIGSNGNSIFIPASGSRSGSSFYGQGSGGCVWGSSLWTKYPEYAYYLEVYLDEYYDPVASENTLTQRYYGYVVRGVL